MQDLGLSQPNYGFRLALRQVERRVRWAFGSFEWAKPGLWYVAEEKAESLPGPQGPKECRSKVSEAVFIYCASKTAVHFPFLEYGNKELVSAHLV